MNDKLARVRALSRQRGVSWTSLQLRTLCGSPASLPVGDDHSISGRSLLDGSLSSFGRLTRRSDARHAQTDGATSDGTGGGGECGSEYQSPRHAVATARCLMQNTSAMVEIVSWSVAVGGRRTACDARHLTSRGCRR